MKEPNLKGWREYARMAQEEAAEFLGINQSAYSKLERAQIKLTTERALRLAEAFGISIQDLLERDPPEAAQQTSREVG